MSDNKKRKTGEKSSSKKKTICLNPQQMWIAEEIANLGRGEKFVVERYEVNDDTEKESSSEANEKRDANEILFSNLGKKTKFRNMIYLLPRQTGKTRIACSAAIARGLASTGEHILYYVPRGINQSYVIKEVLIKALNELSNEKSGGVKLYKEYQYDRVILYNGSVIQVCPTTHGQTLEKDESVKNATLVIFDETVEYEPNQKNWRDSACIRAVTQIEEKEFSTAVSVETMPDIKQDINLYRKITTPPIVIIMSKNLYVETTVNCTVDGKHARLDILDVNYHNPIKNDKHGFVRYPRKEWEVWSYTRNEIGRFVMGEEEYAEWRKLMISDSFDGDEAAFTQEYEPHVIELPHDFDTPKKRMVDIFDFFKE